MTQPTQEQIAEKVKRLREDAQDARDAFAEEWLDAESTGERPDLDPLVFEIGVERAEEVADMLEQLAAERAKPAGVRVKPLEWRETREFWEARTPLGDYRCGFDDGWWAELEGPTPWEWESPEDPRCYDGPSAAMLACKADFDQRILPTLEPAPTHEAGYISALDAAMKKCVALRHPDDLESDEAKTGAMHCALAISEMKQAAIRALLTEKPE